MNSNLNILCVGKIKEQYYRASCEKLSSDLKKQSSFEITEVKDESIPENCSLKEIEKVKSKEAERLLSFIKKEDYVCALCIDGTPLDNRKLKKMILKETEAGKRIVFVIGGSLGLHDSVIRRSDYKISFSNLTFPHQLMRVILAEQLRNIICDR